MINNTTAEVLNRVMSLEEFEVKRTLDEPLQFRGGRVPFDIHADQEHIRFNVLAMTQQEAEVQVDEWLKGQEDNE
jgi:hypothetical protein